jgi:GntR family transcriptional regulator/MocR family aminotransferase
MTVPTPALTIEIDRQQQLPIYLQICERFRTAIAAGHLRPGDRVPALRSLATQLNTARGTVELAYTILVDEGYLQMRGAAGTFVSPSLPASVMRASRAQGVQGGQGRQSTEGTGTRRRQANRAAVNRRRASWPSPSP